MATRTEKSKTSPQPEPTPSTQGTARRRELLGIAASVFAEKGVATSTVRDIADRAGILSGSLYHHFTSKDELVAEVVRDGLEESARRTEAVLGRADGKDAAQTLRSLIIENIQWVADQPDVASILSNDRQYLRDTPALSDVDHMRRTSRLVWVDVIKSGVKSKTFRNDFDPEVIVRAIFDGTLASTRWLPPARRGRPETIGTQLADFYVNGLLER